MIDDTVGYVLVKRLVFQKWTNFIEGKLLYCHERSWYQTNVISCNISNLIIIEESNDKSSLGTLHIPMSSIPVAVIIKSA